LELQRRGGYFITINAKNSQHLFGEINDGKMILNDVGKIVLECWHKIPHLNAWIILGAFVIMPNHIHGIIHITFEASSGRPTPNENPLHRPNWRPGSLGVIINQFKRAVTISARKTHPNFAWQNNYYDRIIRDEKSLRIIEKYIERNPINWGKKT
jgi:putative transposase